jgi:3' exoribonuclease, RNase T-like
MNDIMLDIETLGTSPGYIVTSFCAIPFHLEGGTSSKNFYQSISIRSSLKAGLKIDPDTMIWWMRQSQEARDNFAGLNHCGKDLKETLLAFSEFLAQFETELTLWGNGNRFDCGILEGAYNALSLSAPWKTKLERDMRTYIMDYEYVYKPSDIRGTIHDPMKDCEYQIDVLQEVYRLKHPKFYQIKKSK